MNEIMLGIKLHLGIVIAQLIETVVVLVITLFAIFVWVYMEKRGKNNAHKE